MEVTKKQKVIESILSNANIESLPVETFYEMLLFLPVDAIERVGSIDKKRRALINTVDVWRSLLIADHVIFSDKNRCSLIDSIIENAKYKPNPKARKVLTQEQQDKATIKSLKKGYNYLCADQWCFPAPSFKHFTTPVFFAWGIESGKLGLFQSSNTVTKALDTTGLFYANSYEYVRVIREKMTERTEVKCHVPGDVDAFSLEKLDWFYQRVTLERDPKGKYEFDSNVKDRAPVKLKLTRVKGSRYEFAFTNEKGKMFIFGEVVITSKFNVMETMFTLEFDFIKIDFRKEGYLYEKFIELVDKDNRAFVFSNKEKEFWQIRRKVDELKQLQKGSIKYEVSEPMKIGDKNVSLHSVNGLSVIYDEDKQDMHCEHVMSKEDLKKKGNKICVYCD